MPAVWGENPEGAGVTFFVQVEDLQDSLDKAEPLGWPDARATYPTYGMVELAFFADPREQSYRVAQGLGAATKHAGGAAQPVCGPRAGRWSAQRLSTSGAVRSL